MRARDAYRALLRCYPAPFRQEYGGQMQLDFADQLAAARERGGSSGATFLWLQAIVDAFTIAPREHWHVLARDLRYAWRVMAARPGFTLTAVVSLAIGIGANTAIFSLWNAVLHAPLSGVDRPDQLVMLTNPDQRGSWTGGWNGRTDGPRFWVTYAEFEQLRDQSRRFSSLMASQSSLSTFQIRVAGQDMEEAQGRLVSGAFFEVLGVRPLMGRLFAAADDRVDAPHAVLSHAYWEKRFAGRLDALGATIQVRGATLTVIGVTPAGFMGETSGQVPDMWLPIRLQPQVLPGRDRLHDLPSAKSMWLHVFGRLKPGVTPAAAEAEANTIFKTGLSAFYGASGEMQERDERLKLQSGARGASALRPAMADSLTALLGGVGVLLLIACANIANLLLARGESRRHEVAIRLSLGASRSRLVRQLVTESALLAAMGAVGAVAVAYALFGVLARMATEFDQSFALTFSPDLAVLGMLAATSIGAALLCGVLPAWQLTDTGAGLKEHGRGAVTTRHQARSGRWLVGLQLTLSLPLLVSAGLLARTAYNLQHADLGYRADRLLLARVDLTDLVDVTAQGNVRRLLVDRLRTIPGVISVSYSQLGIFTGGFSNTVVEIPGYTPKGDLDRESAVDVVGPGYFSALGGAVVLGRDLRETDQATSPRVAVVNEAFVRRFFEGRQPLGMPITAVDDDVRTTYQIVGVARDAMTDDVRGAVEPRYFVPGDQAPRPPSSPTLLVRTAVDDPTLLATIRTAIRDASPATPIMSARTLHERMARLTAQDRVIAQLALVFGAIALALAAIGLYGVLSFGVARRTAEIALRLALGAQTRGVIAMILRETLVVVGLGLLAGGALAVAATHLVKSRLYGVEANDVPTLAAAIATLLAVALGAAWLPAVRASRVDPMIALRQE
jgi:predicted permease